MNIGMYQAAAALSANARWQEVISENLASASVPGFKRTEMSFTSFEVGLMPKEAGRDLKYTLPRAATATVFTPGELQSTGVPTHAAIDGPGFFEVTLPTGESGYTRDGSFSLDAAGMLVSKEGHPVASDTGSITFDKASRGEVAISRDGTVSKGSEGRGRLKVVTFADPSKLVAAGGGFWKVPDASVKITDDPSPSIRGGFIEGSNTSPVGEMVSMINAMRLFEANQKVIQAHDERTGRAISELGGTTS